MGCVSGSWWSFRGESSAIYEGYGDSFPGSCAAGLIEFSEEFSVKLLLVENVVEQGSGVDSLVTKKCTQRLLECEKNSHNMVGWLLLFYFAKFTIKPGSCLYTWKVIRF